MEYFTGFKLEPIGFDLSLDRPTQYGIMRFNKMESNFMQNNIDKYLCPKCDGMGDENCRSCDGTGETIIEIEGKKLVEKCEPCGGTGYQECKFCDGSGFQLEEVMRPKMIF